METYEIKLPQFEGPFDLLLFFIERDELDIYDIPIFKITEDFLHFIHQMERLNIEVASEFILVAATLMRIKAKMLLPRKEVNEQGEQIDPREELVNRLMEYKKYKETSEAMRALEEERQQLAKRGNVQVENKEIAALFETEYELQSLTMFKLLKAFQNIMTRMNRETNTVHHTVQQPPFTIAEEKEKMLDLMESSERLAFDEVFAHCENRIHAIFTFLAMLEMIQEQLVKIHIGTTYNQFWLTKTSPEELMASIANA